MGVRGAGGDGPPFPITQHPGGSVMDLDDVGVADISAAERAVARIAELEGQVAALTEERDTLTGRAADLETTRASLEGRLRETAGAHEAASADLAETRSALNAAGERE